MATRLSPASPRVAQSTRSRRRRRRRGRGAIRTRTTRRPGARPPPGSASDELDAGPGAEPVEPVEVGCGRLGKRPLGRRLAHVEEEVLEVVGRLARADHEHAGGLGLHAERVRRAPGDERERAGRRDDDLAVDLELDLAVEDVERLVLVDLHVHRRVGGGGHEVLGEAVGAAGLGGARHRRHQAR